MKLKISTLLVAAALVLGVQTAAWAVPSTIPYQGRLTDGSGTPINAAQSIVFSLFAAPTGGVALWTETQPAVTLANGLFNVDLGSVTAIPATVFSGADLFLEIKVGADAAMTPRQRLGTVAYAMRAGIGPSIASSAVSNIGAAPAGVSNLTSITVTFPTAGFAMVSGTAAFGFTLPGAVTDCFAIEISDVSATLQGGFQNFHCVSQAGYSESNSSDFRVFSVAAGAKTFFLIGNNQQSVAWSVFGARLSVQFFPDALGPINNNEPQSAPSSVQRVGNSQR